MKTVSQQLPTYMSEDVKRAKQRFGIIGNAPALLSAIERAIKVAPIDLSVLVTGASGAGKEFFPKIIHAFGSRKHSKYIAVNCGAIPEGTIDSELFGHEKGSFTGAISARKGYFEEASGGTIFLDEVAELPLTTQARLLRVLETGEFLKVGSSLVQKTDIRVVAATNVNLIDAVQKGKFREDLYYRLSTVQIQVPELHRRGDDVLLLARKFASDFAEKYMMPPITFSESANMIMKRYNWPGNVRQLKNMVEQIALFNAGEKIEQESIREYLPEYLHSGAESRSLQTHEYIPTYEVERQMLWHTILQMQAEIKELTRALNTATDTAYTTMDEQPEGNVAAPTNGGALMRLPNTDSWWPMMSHASAAEDAPTTLEENEKEAIIKALERNGGVRKRAAKELNITERTLYRKLKEYGIN